MQHHDYDAVVYDGDICCIGCLPDGVDVDDVDEYDNDICAPIFAGSEWDYAPVCCVCSEVHDYVTVIKYPQPDVKYQVWVEDTYLAGHIYLPKDTCDDDVAYAAQDFIRDTWGDADDDDISVCEISESYYRDITDCTAEDSILLGM